MCIALQPPNAGANRTLLSPRLLRIVMLDPEVSGWNPHRFPPLSRSVKGVWVNPLTEPASGIRKL